MCVPAAVCGAASCGTNGHHETKSRCFRPAHRCFSIWPSHLPTREKLKWSVGLLLLARFRGFCTPLFYNRLDAVDRAKREISTENISLISLESREYSCTCAASPTSSTKF
jgi:hypothetical protein